MKALTILAAAVLCVGCEAQSGPSSQLDGGAGADAGPNNDGGLEVDSGQPPAVPTGPTVYINTMAGGTTRSADHRAVLRVDPVLSHGKTASTQLNFVLTSGGPR